VEYCSPVNPSARVRSDITGTFLVDPSLYLPTNSFPILLPLDGIVIQTVIPKWLPKIQDWNSHFQISAKTGYNMMHFAPLQKRGSSDSPYSIYDQLSFDDEYFESDKLTNHEKNEIMGQALLDLENQYNILPVTDVVWNHTANNSRWLKEHPESGFK